jgi:hypothetical protein
VFGQLCQSYPTNEWGALAWGELGDCCLQLNNFDAATNAYAQVFASPFADISARSQAQVGFGIALEKKAALVFGGNQNALLQLGAGQLSGRFLRDQPARRRAGGFVLAEKSRVAGPGRHGGIAAMAPGGQVFMPGWRRNCRN